MRTGYTYADKSFDRKLKVALADRNFSQVEKLFYNYGQYLILIGD